MSDTEQEQETGDYEWSAYYDDEGRLYYYNATTEESSWDVPEGGYNPPPPADDNGGEAEEEQNSVTDEMAEGISTGGKDNDEKDFAGPTSPSIDPGRDDDDTMPTSPANYPGQDGDDAVPTSPANDPIHNEGDNTTPSSPANYPASPDLNEPTALGLDGDGSKDTIQWVAYNDDEGNEYYYNNETGETQWEKPDRFLTADEYEDMAGQGQAEEEPFEDDEPPKQPMSEDEMDRISDQDSEVEEKEPEIDPEVLKVLKAEEALNKPDSILEPNCIANVRVVVPAHGGKPEMAIKSLIDAYHGQTAVCGLLARWYIEFKQHVAAATASSSTTTKNQQDIKTLVNMQQHQNSEADANFIRDVSQEVINRIANERFTREAGDSILELGKSEAAFLVEMIDSTRWRKLLIDLSASHKDSAVLLHCLRAISKKGHHREIAKRINQSDHFTVFNAMLLSELAVVGCTAVSAGSDIPSSSGFEELLNDLQRACSSTSYTYLYSLEMLRTLEAKALQESLIDDSRPMQECRFLRAMRKWQALIQLLESAMVDPAAAQSVAGSSPLFRKRRLDVALTISELHQRQRQRRLNTETNLVVGEYHDNAEKDDQKDLETSMLMLLRRYSTGTQIGDAVLDKLLPTGLDMNTRGVGNLLLKHPLSIRALLGHMYKPGTTRINATVTKNKCARLLALAVLAAEQTARDDIHTHHGYSDSEILPEEEIDEVALTRMILQGSQLCEQIETMISFSVTTESQENIGTVSPGQKLCALALKCAPVGLGVMMWAREFTHGAEFPQSASFPTISPSVMSLVRLIALKHPFTRPDALQVALAFLRHSNPDISYQKVNSLKEQALRLMVFLLMKGDVAPVLSSITTRLSKSGSSELDASLVRYFVGSVLEVVRAPFSPVFVRLFSALLNSPRTVDAVRSTYFAKDSRQRLAAMLQSFRKTKMPNGVPMGGEDAALVATLLATYQIE